MQMSKRLLCAALCAALVACGSPDPVAYSGIASSSQMAANAQDDSQRVPYRYSTPVDWQTYSKPRTSSRFKLLRPNLGSTLQRSINRRQLSKRKRSPRRFRLSATN